MKSIIIVALFSIVYSVESNSMPQEAVVVPPVTYEKSPGKIVGGDPALSHQFPWQASITSCSWVSCSLCGGSLISRKHVLTAAHCTKGLSSFTIGLGSNIRNNPALSVKSKSKKEHPEYNAQTLANDVAIITLASSVNLNNDIKLISLASVFIGELTNRDSIVSGYGKTSPTSQASNTLNQLNMSIISNYDCSRVFGSSIRSSTLCAVGKASVNKNVCQGDSGGPLVINQLGSYVQVGIVSFVASAGCDAGYPSGYARVSSFRNWITQNMN